VGISAKPPATSGTGVVLTFVLIIFFVCLFIIGIISGMVGVRTMFCVTVVAICVLVPRHVVEVVFQLVEGGTSIIHEIVSEAGMYLRVTLVCGNGGQRDEDAGLTKLGRNNDTVISDCVIRPRIEFTKVRCVVPLFFTTVT
jgi:hypothetical protein